MDRRSTPKKRPPSANFQTPLQPQGQTPITNKSPNRSKVNEMKDNLNNNINIQSELSKRQNFEARLKYLEEKLKVSYINDESTFKLFKDQLIKLQEALNSQIIARQLIEEKKDKELKIFDTNTSLDINIQRQNRQEAEEEINIPS